MSGAVVLTTRPAADAGEDCAFFASHGVSAHSASSLAIEERDFSLSDEPYDAVILTSRHAAARLAGCGLTEKPCYAVGEATARAAAGAGFSNITSGGGDGAALAGLLLKTDHRRFCWPTAPHGREDIKQRLEAAGGRTIDRLIVYEAVPIKQLDKAVLAIIGSASRMVVLVHSGRAGAHFRHLVEGEGLIDAISRMELVAVSAHAAGLCGKGWRSINVVAMPLRSLMLEKALQLAAGGIDVPASPQD